ncbi:MAG TPA: PAS domain-containing sensor histidine kinase [Patescibacteria group bacterium]
MDSNAVLENIGDGLIVTDKNGTITYLNHTALELLKFNKDEVIDKLLTELIPFEDSQEHLLTTQDHPLTQVLSSATKVAGIYYFHRHDDTKFPASVTMTPLMADNDVIGSIHLFRDVTSDQERERIKDESISLIAHELRTPMAAVKGLISMIIKGDYGVVSADLQGPLKNVYISAEKQLHLINNLYTISRLQTGKVRFTLSNFSLAQIIQELVTFWQSEAQKKGIAIKLEDTQETFAYADNIWTKEILNNLFENAVHFTNSGEITIAYRLEEGRVLVVLKDTGVGINPADQDKVFLAFRHTEDSSLGKFGMGLYISREIARAMGGDVWLEKSTPGEGSTFICALPVKVDLEK